MPSPFPGMDPYLENTDLFSGLHSWLIMRMAEELNAVLPLEYVAAVEEWLTIFPTENRIEPDVFIRDQSAPAGLPRGGLAVMEPARGIVDAPFLVEADSESAKVSYINILRADDESYIVTTIEILSPTNKTPGKDQNAYKRKQRDICASATHLIEIDLLRGGAHTVAVPLDLLGDKAWDYIVCLHRGLTGRKYEVWFSTVREHLPRIYVPLDEGQPHIPLDLQNIFEKCYAAGAYARRIDYREKPKPPLRPEDAEWADLLLRGV